MKEFYIFAYALIAVIHSIAGQAEIVFSPPSNHEAKSEKPFSVSCRISTNDDATFQWFGPDDQEITNKDSTEHLYLRNAYPGLRLHFRSVVDDDAGTYKCKASITNAADSSVDPPEGNFVLTVRSSIKFDNCPDVQKGLQGKEVAIGCSASAGGTPTSIMWEKQGMPLGSGNGYTSNDTHLTIANVTLADEGNYEVIAVTDVDTDSRTVQFEVMIAPKIIDQIRAETATVGEKAALYCRASGRPLPEISWFKEGSTNPLRDTGRIVVRENNDGETKQGILEFTKIEKNDEATYKCVAKNDGAEAQTENKLTVQIPPIITEMPEVLGTEGSPAQLRCEAHGDPVPDMMFTQKGSNKQYRPGTSVEGITVESTPIAEPSNPGAILTVAFATLNHAHAGTWDCEAANTAATDTKTVKLDVRFAPNFDQQETGPFYNWAGNKEGHLPCTAIGNPLPVFSWFKDDKEITAADSFYSIVREEGEVIEDKPQSVTSKLMITYTGLNEDVFAEYICTAKNAIGQNTQNLTMSKGAPPPAPDVSITVRTATYVEVWLYEPSVQGPAVEFFKVSYKKRGSNEDPVENTVPKTEEWDHVDAGRRYTTVDIKNLDQRSEYAFDFYAINPVGTGPANSKVVNTPKKSVPGVVKIETETNSQYTNKINLMWNVPDDGGAPINSYRVYYMRVALKNTNKTTQGYEIQATLSAEQVLHNIVNTQVELTGLYPGSYYRVQVIAINSEGGSEAAIKFIKTKEGDEGGLSTGAIIGIVVVIFIILLIATDLTCYFKNNCGLLMSIKEKIGGRRGDEGYSAAKTDDVENLAKKDELTEEAKAAEEGDMVADDEKKAPLLSGEQKVDTVDEVDTPPEKELEPEDKEVIKEDAQPAEAPPAEETKPEEPAETVSAPEPAQQPATDEAADKTTE